jgi:hypothetical protein
MKKFEITLIFVDDTLLPVKFTMDLPHKPTSYEIEKLAHHNGYANVEVINIVELVKLRVNYERYEI